MTVEPKGWPIVDTPASKSVEGDTHTVRRSPGGSLWCSCRAFEFSRANPSKRCSHVDAQVAKEERLAISLEDCAGAP